MSSYSELDPKPIHDTIAVLRARIGERFPDSGLSRVAAELERLAEVNAEVVRRLGQPIWWLRGLTVMAIAGLIAAVLWGAAELMRLAAGGVGGVTDVLEGIDAAISELLFLSIVLLFLVSLETRLKRRTALKTLHGLRSLAHVVDMHQLNKDPEHALGDVSSTPSSPKRTLNREQLTRYLDYCSELLALTSKLAALHAQHMQDAVVLEAVNDIESLTAGLSRNIWQKITILDVAGGRAMAKAPLASAEVGISGPALEAPGVEPPAATASPALIGFTKRRRGQNDVRTKG